MLATQRSGGELPERAPRQELDQEALELPSDRVTFQSIRKAQPHLCSGQGTNETALWKISVFQARVLELRFAENAYAKAHRYAKGEGVLADVDYESCIEQLNGYYTQYGLSEGRYGTEELIRTIERQAAQQASVLRTQG